MALPEVDGLTPFIRTSGEIPGHFYVQLQQAQKFIWRDGAVHSDLMPGASTEARGKYSLLPKCG